MAMTTNRNGFTMFHISAAHYLVQAIDTADAVISIRSGFWTLRGRSKKRLDLAGLQIQTPKLAIPRRHVPLGKEQRSAVREPSQKASESGHGKGGAVLSLLTPVG